MSPTPYDGFVPGDLLVYRYAYDRSFAKDRETLYRSREEDVIDITGVFIFVHRDGDRAWLLSGNRYLSVAVDDNIACMMEQPYYLLYPDRLNNGFLTVDFDNQET